MARAAAASPNRSGAPSDYPSGGVWNNISSRSQYGARCGGLRKGKRRVTTSSDTDAASPGTLFGPDSISRKVHADPAMWPAGVRALYLEALHPRAVRGVLDNSSFRRDPIGRLTRTAKFVAVATFAPAQVAEQAARRVRRIHRALSAADPQTGEIFPLDDPALLLWIHCASTSSYIEVVRRSGLRLSPAQSDRYVDEQRATAALVGLEPDTVPGSMAELDDYFAEQRPLLRAGDDAQEIYRFLTDPPMPPGLRRLTAPLGPMGTPLYGVASRQVWSRMSRVAYSALPDWAVELYGHRAYSAASTTRSLRSLRTAGRMVPRSLIGRVVGL
ncbi:uncharacterized protein (DUF2236 family) [Catenulispora sp. MAP12-49]